MSVRFDPMRPVAANGIPAYLDRPILGDGEISGIYRNFCVDGYVPASLWPTFDLNERGDDIARSNPTFVMDVHRWASDNFRGPWFLNEFVHFHKDENVYERYFSLYAEWKEDKERLLQGQYGALFCPENQRRTLLTSLAKVKGLYHGWSAETDVFGWLALNLGYQEYYVDNLYRLRPDTNIMDNALRKYWVKNKEIFKKAENGFYECPIEYKTSVLDGEERKTYASFLWHYSHHAWEPISPGKDDIRYYQFKHKTVESAFKEKWKDDYTWDKTRKAYCVNLGMIQQLRPTFVAPQVLTDYIDGKAPDPAASPPARPEPLQPLIRRTESTSFWEKLGIK